MNCWMLKRLRSVNSWRLKKMRSENDWRLRSVKHRKMLIKRLKLKKQRN